MIPVTFNDCFGWLHAPGDDVAGDVGVVICPGLMRDGLLAYCSLRLLADELAAVGYWALRFDYPGTGDSCDGAIEREGGHWPAWMKSVDQAADWLRAQTGVRRLVLCGLRTGATLATLIAARREDAAGLLLFEPVTNGRSYVRQLILEADLQSGKTSTRGEALEIRDFRLSAATLDSMAAVDLRRTGLGAVRKVAVFSRPETRQIDECVQAWAAAGVEATAYGWDGLVPLMRHSVIDENVLADFSGARGWFKDAMPPVRAVSLPASARAPEPAELRPPGCVETPLRFGNGRLVGILCRPAQGASDQVMLIGNGGRDPHYGAARQNVDFARHLAQLGVSCLRFDFAGLGDSLGPPGKENVLSETFADRLQDIGAALDALEALGYRRFSMLGLCSGAYHAFHGALADQRLAGLLLVNMPLFVLPKANVLEFLEERGRSPMTYVRKLFHPGSWVTLLSGRTNIRTSVRALSTHIARQVRSKTQGLARRAGLLKEQSFAVQAMAALSQRGARVLFLFSPGETEIDAFAREFGANGEGLAAFPGSAVTVLPRMDHDLTIATGRNDAKAVVAGFLLAMRQ